MKNISIILGTLATIVLALVAARYVSGWWLFWTFASLQVHLAAVAFVLGALSFLFRRHILNMLIIVAAIALGVHGVIMLNDFRQPALENYGNTPTAKLLSLNIEGDNSFANGKKIADYMIKSGADVIFIQESAPLFPELARISTAYPYRLGCGNFTITCDSSVWSKTPFVSSLVKTASPIYRDRLQIASIEFGGKVINFANVHLTKPYFDDFQAKELKKITQWLDKVPGPLVLAGDFNSTVLNPVVQRFLEDRKLMSVDGEPTTIPIQLPEIGMAIDHVFVGGPMRITSLTRVPDPIGSNHYGLMAEVTLTDPTASYPPKKVVDSSSSTSHPLQ
jgi:endonuclease/exonuclease/phosphatase (EEP) superfamily protein YafD